MLLDFVANSLNESIEYLNSLSREKHKEKRKQEIDRKTIKHKNIYSDINGGSQQVTNTNSPYVNIELPEELKNNDPPRIGRGYGFIICLSLFNVLLFRGIPYKVPKTIQSVVASV